MPTIFAKETAVMAGQIQDRGKLVEIDQHQLLTTEDRTSQIASFDQVKAIGSWFLGQEFNTVLPSVKPLPAGLLARHELTGGGAFLGKLALGADPESQFPATIEVVKTPTGRDLRVHIVPIHFGALEVAEFGQHTDGLLALAAAAAVAPWFVMALEDGIETTHCATKKEVVTSVTPDHGTPLAVTFDAFGLGTQTLDSAIAVTGNRDLSIKQAAHLHGQDQPDSKKISGAAARSKIAAGVPIRTLLRSELPRHALFINTLSDAVTGEPKIVTMNESLWLAGLETTDLAFLAAALGFTARVVGDSARERVVEKVLSPASADTPLTELVRQ